MDKAGPKQLGLFGQNFEVCKRSRQLNVSELELQEPSEFVYNFTRDFPRMFTKRNQIDLETASYIARQRLSLLRKHGFSIDTDYRKGKMSDTDVLILYNGVIDHIASFSGRFRKKYLLD